MRKIPPGALGQLAVENLANAGEYAALGRLAAAADQEAAIRWMWAIARSGDQPQHWNQVERNLAGCLKVPANLRDDVRRFILTPASQYHTSYPQPVSYQRGDPRRRAQVRFLEKLDPSATYTQELAREVLDADEDRYLPELRHAAFDILGSSNRKTDRTLILERT